MSFCNGRIGESAVCRADLRKKEKNMRKTKIVCTMGPACNTEEMMEKMLRSGMNIGCDMIGTMTNTLILAFAGGTLATLVIFMSYGIQFDQLISSNFIAAEIAAGVAGSLGIVLTVPLSALVCSYTLNKKIKIKNSDKKHRRKYEY